MRGGRCAFCGIPLEPDARFCAGCGRPVHTVDATEGAGPAPLARMPPVYLKPPRNPRQTASYAAGVMVLVSGVFALMFGNLILFWDAWDTVWMEEAGVMVSESVINAGALFPGVLYITAFAVCLGSAYCSFRLTRYQVAVAGPVMLLVGYFSTLAYELWMLIVAVHVLIMAVASLALLYYAIPIYEGRRVGGDGPSARFQDPPGPSPE